MPKKITMTAKPSSATADDWVAGGSTELTLSAPTLSAPALPVAAALSADNDANAVNEPIALKRLTIDIPEELHARIKSQCALRRSKMADEIRKLLESGFPENV